MANEIKKKKPGREPLGVDVKNDGKGVVHLAATGDLARLANAVTLEVTEGLLKQVAIIGSQGKQIDGEASNFILGFVDAMDPQDPVEALLLTQMAAIHQSTLMLARRLNHVETIVQQDAAERALNKLARTYAAQVDTLKRYRSKGQQVVRVERVTVEEGGKAIVGNVAHGGRGGGEN